MRGKYEGRKASILYYKCPNAMNRLSGLEEVCHEKSVNGKRLEGFIWDFVMHLFSDQGQFERALHQAR